MQSLLEFVEVEVAKAARGVRMVVASVVPSPWSEAAKGLFRIQGVPVLAVRNRREDPTVAAWTGHHNVPVVFHDDEPARTVWSEIVMLAERLRPGGLVPTELERRARTIGLIHEVAGEEGLGWSARLLMIDASLTSEGARGFPLPVARYLAAKYGHTPGCAEAARTRCLAVLQGLRHALGDADYFDGDRPGALDVYSATFLTPLCELGEDDCPALTPALRRGFAAGRDALAGEVPPALLAHRTRMLTHHLGWPIAL
jgi:hypothetical protein